MDPAQRCAHRLQFVRRLGQRGDPLTQLARARVHQPARFAVADALREAADAGRDHRDVQRLQFRQGVAERFGHHGYQCGQMGPQVLEHPGQLFAIIVRDHVDAGQPKKRLTALARAQQVDLGERPQARQGLEQQLLALAGLDAPQYQQPQPPVRARARLDGRAPGPVRKSMRDHLDAERLPPLIECCLQCCDRLAGCHHADRSLTQQSEVGIPDPGPAVRAKIIELVARQRRFEGEAHIDMAIRSPIIERVEAQKRPHRETIMQHLDGRQPGVQRLQAVADQGRDDHPANTVTRDDLMQELAVCRVGLLHRQDGGFQPSAGQREFEPVTRVQGQPLPAALPGLRPLGSQLQVPRVRVAAHECIDPALHAAAPTVGNVQGDRQIVIANRRQLRRAGIEPVLQHSGKVAPGMGPGGFVRRQPRGGIDGLRGVEDEHPVVGQHLPAGILQPFAGVAGADSAVGQGGRRCRAERHEVVGPGRHRRQVAAAHQVDRRLTGRPARRPLILQARKRIQCRRRIAEGGQRAGCACRCRPVTEVRHL